MPNSHTVEVDGLRFVVTSLLTLAAVRYLLIADPIEGTGYVKFNYGSDGVRPERLRIEDKLPLTK